MFKITYCCCGCTLETGTLLTLYLYEAFAMLDIALAFYLGTVKNHFNVFRMVVGAIVPIPGLIGVYGKQPMLLLPFMIHTCIYLAIFVIFMAVFAFMQAKLLNDLGVYFYIRVKEKYQSIDDQGQMTDEKQPEKPLVPDPMDAGFVVLVEVVAAILFGIYFYMFIVVLNYFNKLTNQQLTFRERIRNWLL